MKKAIIMGLGMLILGGCQLPWTAEEEQEEKRPEMTEEIRNRIKLLNSAFADEWLAYYQYWIGARVVQGPMKKEVIEELEQHANDEKRHAKMLADRIMELGGTPLLAPEDWFKYTECGFLTPNDPGVKKILEQNIVGEQCAIRAYKKLLDETKEIDEKTYKMIQEILKDEIEHEEDLTYLYKKL